MHTNDTYFAPSTIRFPYEIKKIFHRILHELQYIDKVHPHHFILDHLDWVFEYRFIQSRSYSRPVTNVELELCINIENPIRCHRNSISKLNFRYYKKP